MFLGILAALALTVGTVESTHLLDQEQQNSLQSSHVVTQSETAEIRYFRDFSE